MNDFYILDGHKPVVEPNLLKWGEFMGTNDKIVKQEKIGKVKISTIFLGLDHSWNGPPPLLFETMIFGGKHKDYQERYTTWKLAIEGHRQAVEMVKRRKK